MSASDTPMVDERFGGNAATDAGYWAALDMARKLEREAAAMRSERDRYRKALETIRNLRVRRMGDYWTHEEGLSPDTTFDIIDEALNPPT